MKKRALSREEVERFRAEAGPPVGAPTDSDVEAAWALLQAGVRQKAHKLRASRVVVTLDGEKAASQTVRQAFVVAATSAIEAGEHGRQLMPNTVVDALARIWSPSE